jgi:transcriptional regulator with XRE-family HTH domain
MKNNKIAKVLKAFRKKNHYTVNDVALFLEKKDVKVAPKTIYGWESGQSQPDADTLLVLCELYNITDILASFGYVEKSTFPLTTLEKELVLEFRKHPPMQDAVRKLLDF